MLTKKPSSIHVASRRLYSSRLARESNRIGDKIDFILDEMDAQRAYFCADEPGVSSGIDTYFDSAYAHAVQKNRSDADTRLPSERIAVSLRPRPIHSVVVVQDAHQSGAGAKIKPCIGEMRERATASMKETYRNILDLKQHEREQAILEANEKAMYSRAPVAVNS